MGPHIAVLPDNSEHVIVDADQVTNGFGKKIPVAPEVELTAVVLENESGKASSVRFEIMDEGHRNNQAYYGQLPELGNVDFQTTAGLVSVFHKEKE